MKKIYYIPIEENFIDTFVEKFLPPKQDYSDIAIVFPNKRPFLFLQRRMTEKIKKSYFPTTQFTMDSFIHYILEQNNVEAEKINHIDYIWHLYQIVQNLKTPFEFDSFERFFPWGEKIAQFLDQIDTENISDDKLREVSENAAIGYESVPDQVNAILVGIIQIRKQVHQYLEDNQLVTRGWSYLKALELIDRVKFSEFNKIYFAGLFALTNVEKTIIKKLWENEKAEIVWNAHPDDFPLILKSIKNEFKPTHIEKVSFFPHTAVEPKLYSSFDIHSEIVQTFQVLNSKDIKNTVIVLPRSETLFPLLSLTIDGIQDKIENFNISLQYPLMRTSLFALVQKIVEIQNKTRIQNNRKMYHSKDYISIISNPFLKNINSDNSIIRFFVMNVIQALKGNFSKSTLNNKIFISLDDILQDKILFENIHKMSPLSISETEIKNQIIEFHTNIFSNFETLQSFADLTQSLKELLNYIIKKSQIRSYILSGEILSRLYALIDELSQLEILNEKFSQQFFISLFSRYLQNESITFSTRPLQELELIGMLETRNLNFDTVLILDVQDEILPGKRSIDPLIPIEVYKQLGLPNYEKKVEMNQYYFDRLVKSGKDVHLFYINNEDKMRSRFIEQIVWNKEKQEKKLNVYKPNSISFAIHTADNYVAENSIQKTEKIMNKLETMNYSATAIKSYVNCGLQFYYRYILGLHEENTISENLDADMRGILVHDILRDTYNESKKIENYFTIKRKDELCEILNNQITIHFGKLPRTGELLLMKKIVQLKLKQFIESDLAKRPFSIKELETPYSMELQRNKISIKIKGQIDRIEKREHNYVIVDYKTGSANNIKIAKLEAIPEENPMEFINEESIDVQLPLYILLFQNANPSISLDNIDAKFVFFTSKSKDNEKLLFKNGEKEEVMNYYKHLFDIVFSDLFNLQTPFKKWKNTDCKYCSFTKLCPSSSG